MPPAKIAVSLPAFVITISVIIVLMLFWLFFKNAQHISSVLDKKLSLEHGVNALTQLVGEVAKNSPPPLLGDATTTTTTPMSTLLNSLEHIHLINDPKAYVFIFDSAGNQIADGSAPLRTRPGLNMLNYVDSDGNPVVKMLIDRASSGGGYVEFKWPDPITKHNSKKLAYVKLIPNTPSWLLGSGIYQ